jgi:hypothetical protein
VAVGEAHFNFFGLPVSVRGWPQIVEAIDLDFSWFRALPADRVGLTVDVTSGSPNLDSLPAVPAAFSTPRNVVYQLGGRTIVDYFGRTVVILDRERRRAFVEGDPPALVHEAIYLLLLHRVGEHLDASGMMRLHAVALAGRQGAVTILLPAGGGKTTLALRALRQRDVQLLSDDTPLLDRQGRVHPFPLRLGVSESVAVELPPEDVRRIERFEFPAKHAIRLDAFGDRISKVPHQLRHLVLGRRSLGKEARLAPVPRRRAIGPLLRDGVVGLGIAQMAEYVLQRGWSDVLSKGGVAGRRAAICARALAQAQTWEAELGRDGERNWSALEPLFR